MTQDPDDTVLPPEDLHQIIDEQAISALLDSLFPEEAQA